MAPFIIWCIIASLFYLLWRYVKEDEKAIDKPAYEERSSRVFSSKPPTSADKEYPNNVEWHHYVQADGSRIDIYRHDGGGDWIRISSQDSA